MMSRVAAPEGGADRATSVDPHGEYSWEPFFQRLFLGGLGRGVLLDRVLLASGKAPGYIQY